jgi:hypothetical protein
MKTITLVLDIKTVMIFLLLVIVTFLLFNGSPSQAQSNSLLTAFTPGDGGVYFSKNNKIYWRSKDDCSDGCN